MHKKKKKIIIFILYYFKTFKMNYKFIKENYFEKELINYIKELENIKEENRNYKNLYNFLNKLILKDIKIELNEENKNLATFLYTADNNLIWPLANKIFKGFSIKMIIPNLNNSLNLINYINKKKLNLFKRSISSPRNINFFNNNFKKLNNNNYLQNEYFLTDRDILPKIALSKADQFFYCYPKNQKEMKTSSLSFTVKMSNEPPSHKIKIKTLNQNGFFQIYEGKNGEFIELEQFLNDKEHFHLTRLLPVFQNWYRNKAFLKWHSLFRTKKHKRIIKSISNICPFESNIFFEYFLKIKEIILLVFKDISPINPKLPMETFDQLYLNSKKSLEIMKTSIQSLNEKLKNDIEFFFQQIIGINYLLNSNFEVLKSIGALPKSLLYYAEEKQFNSSSLTTIRTRNILLNKERFLAKSRKDYIPQFFLSISLFLRDFRSIKLKNTLKEFYQRFTEIPSNFQHQIELRLDFNEGLIMYPSYEEFIKWFNFVDENIQKIYLEHELKLSEINILQILSNNHIPIINCDKNSIFCIELFHLKEKALNEIKEAFILFDKRHSINKEFFLECQNKIIKIKNINNFISVDNFVETSNEFFDLINKIENLQRILQYGSLYTDLKTAKVSILSNLTNCMEKTKYFGVKKAFELFEDLSIKRRTYLQDIRKPFTKDIKEEILILNDTINKSNDHLLITGTILKNWEENIPDINEQFEIVKEIKNVALNALKPLKISHPWLF